MKIYWKGRDEETKSEKYIEERDREEEIITVRN